MINNKYTKIAITVALGLGLSTSVFASNSATQTATYEVSAINEITVTGSPSLNIVDAETLGSGLTAVSDTSTSWAITNNAGDDAKKLTVALDSDMPTDTTLSITMVGPSGSTAATSQLLSTIAVDAVTAIDSVSETGLAITYDMTALVTADVVASATKTVTFTLADTGA